MSVNRENVTWQSQNGTWNIGFYTVIEPSFDSRGEDYDREWDVDYDFDTFWWASTGHHSAAAADASWRGANPGTGTTVPYKGNAAECNRYDEMVKCLRDPAYAAAQKDKKDRASAREAAAAVEAQIANQPLVQGAAYNVFIGLNGTGFSSTVRLEKDGDWFVYKNGTKKQKVYNTKTGKVWIGKVHGEVQGVQSIRKPGSVRRGWY